jgi:predicted nucleotidyltransferase
VTLDSAIVEQIRATLARIEREENCLICLTVESGSRAWGFESRDSDYDVRFVYVRPWSFYLSTSLEERRDVIELPISDELDVSGWDLRKALRLLQKSNPALLEWLRSPLVYYERSAIADGLRRLATQFYAPRASFHHYLHMAEGNFKEYLRGETVWRKKYFYVLRPLLAVRWIEANRGPVPMKFSKLLETLDSEPLRRDIDELLVAKRAGAELDEGPRIATISDFIESELSRARQASEASEATDANPKALDGFFLGALLDAWGPMPA